MTGVVIPFRVSFRFSSLHFQCRYFSLHTRFLSSRVSLSALREPPASGEWPSCSTRRKLVNRKRRRGGKGEEGVERSLQPTGWLASISILAKLDPFRCSLFSFVQSSTLQACKGVHPLTLSQRNVVTIRLFFTLLLAVSRGDAIRILCTDHSTRVVREQGPDRNRSGREEKGRKTFKLDPWRRKTLSQILRSGLSRRFPGELFRATSSPDIAQGASPCLPLERPPTLTLQSEKVHPVTHLSSWDHPIRFVED